jgi:hypothetical protein
MGCPLLWEAITPRRATDGQGLRKSHLKDKSGSWPLQKASISQALEGS